MKFTIEDDSRVWRNDKGERHNIISPAFEVNGLQLWCRNGLSHRLDGPAEEFLGGYTCWCWLGKTMSEQHHTLISNRKFFTKRVKL